MEAFHCLITKMQETGSKGVLLITKTIKYNSMKGDMPNSRFCQKGGEYKSAINCVSYLPKNLELKRTNKIERSNNVDLLRTCPKMTWH